MVQRFTYSRIETMKRFRVLLIISALLLVLIISFISTFEILSVNQAIEEFNGKFSSDAEKAEYHRSRAAELQRKRGERQS